jgi:hypothetical protein
MVDYQKRHCLSCGKPVPRWENGRETRRKFCGEACEVHHRRRLKKLAVGSEKQVRSGIVKGVGKPASDLKAALGYAELHASRNAHFAGTPAQKESSIAVLRGGGRVSGASPPHTDEIAAGGLLRPFHSETMATQPERQDRLQRRGGFG